MPDQFEIFLSERKELVDQYIGEQLESTFVDSGSEFGSQTGISNLQKSIAYSLKNGGKRFRPVLALLVAEEFGVAPNRILPFAAAVEMIHTYSLIHDDLPCMDNDDFRRGQPTNHKIFSEATALLAGDSLLTEAFLTLATCYAESPVVAVRLIRLLSEAAGWRGMVGGQVVDMAAKGNLPNLQQLEQMHLLKTGALIRVSCEGTAVACGLSQEKIKHAREFGEHVGFAFQLKDDLLDSSEDKIEKGSFPDLIGILATSQLLQATNQKAYLSLTKMGILQGKLYQLVEYNSRRFK